MVSRERFELELEKIKSEVAPDYVGPPGASGNDSNGSFTKCLMLTACGRMGLGAHYVSAATSLYYSGVDIDSVYRDNDAGVPWHQIIDRLVPQPAPVVAPEPELEEVTC